MFVEITAPKGLIEMDIWYKEKRKANGGKVSPEIAMEALSYTNNFANIKFMLKDIESLETTEEKMKFKDVIFSMIEGRFSSADTIEKMRSIASECGFLDEFDKHRIYCNMQLKKGGFASLRRVYHNRFPKFCKISTLEELQEKAEFWGNNIDETPDVLICDVKGCIDLLGVDLPKYCDFSKASSVKLENVKGVENLKLKEDCDLMLAYMDVPKNVEFNKYKQCRFMHCRFVGCNRLSFKEGASCALYSCSNLPSNIDLSMCDSVYFSSLDLSGVKKVKLKDSAAKSKFKFAIDHYSDCIITTIDEECAMRKHVNALF